MPIQHLPAFRFTALASCPSAAFAPPLFAQTVAQALPEVTICATRERRNVDETTAPVTVIPAEEFEERFVKDIRDLVLIQVDGMRVPAGFYLARRTSAASSTPMSEWTAIDKIADDTNSRAALARHLLVHVAAGRAPSASRLYDNNGPKLQCRSSG